MKFQGYWVEGLGDHVKVTPDEFDETELDPEFEFRRHIETSEVAEGFVSEAAVEILVSVARRLLETGETTKRSDSAFEIQSKEALAQLILALSGEE